MKEKEYLQELEKYPTLQEFWMNVLYTHILHQPQKFHYILQHFNNCKKLEQDYLENTTITEKGILYEIALNHYDYQSKKNNGVYYTPEDTANFMAQHYNSFFNNPQGIWLDPCCGVGNLSHALTRNLPKHINKEQFILHNLTCADIDKLVLFTARLFLVLEFQEKETNLFNKLEPKFHHLNYLANYTTQKTPNLFEQTTNSRVIEYDYVIMNPPYVSKQHNPNYYSNSCGDYYAYFIERALIEAKGFISITPQSYTNSQKFIPLRELLLKDNHSFQCYNFDNIPDSIFKGRKIGVTNSNKSNSVRASILIFKKDNNSQQQLTPLLRWTAKQRPQLFTNTPQQLASPELTTQCFPKIPKPLTSFYQQLKNLDTLETLLSPTPTEYKLTLPTTPRYYITASKRELQRGSKTTLYFTNTKDYNYAYILLNSYITYFWWRAFDGGMTLTNQVLKTLPLVGYKNCANIDKLVELLEDSEQHNLVIKMNAGKPQENIKHSAELKQACTETLTQDTSIVKFLEDTTKNSFIE